MTNMFRTLYTLTFIYIIACFGTGCDNNRGSQKSTKPKPLSERPENDNSAGDNEAASPYSTSGNSLEQEEEQEQEQEENKSDKESDDNFKPIANTLSNDNLYKKQLKQLEGLILIINKRNEKDKADDLISKAPELEPYLSDDVETIKDLKSEVLALYETLKDLALSSEN